jgi:hypothetical protein
VAPEAVRRARPGFQGMPTDIVGPVHEMLADRVWLPCLDEQLLRLVVAVRAPGLEVALVADPAASLGSRAVATGPAVVMAHEGARQQASQLFAPMTRYAVGFVEICLMAAQAHGHGWIAVAAATALDDAGVTVDALAPDGS